MVGLVIVMSAVLVLILACALLTIKLKVEHDTNEILKAKIVGRMIRCD
jgi:hypothetical protein